MAEVQPKDVPASRRRIIERPRLTRLLDQTSSRIIMLVAPAGYGKTTLAQQWLADKPHAWFRGSSESQDIAALAAILSGIVSDLVPGAGERLQARLRASPEPEREVDVFVDLMVEDLAGWPRGAWLAFDDYQFAMESPFAERFIGQLALEAPVQLILTSRRRPTWASARRLLYGEIYEIGQAALTMDEEEASAVLAHRPLTQMPGLVALAGGWPAVIGLAALTDTELPESEVPHALYDYFAAELYKEASPAVQKALCRLAILPTLDPSVASAVLGTDSTEILEEAARIGFFSLWRHSSELHPLLKSFLTTKFTEMPPDESTRIVRLTAEKLLQCGRWDDVFVLIKRLGPPDLMDKLIEVSLSDLVSSGRLATLERWTEYAHDCGFDSPPISLARAEVAFRQGRHSSAKALALQAAHAFGDDHPLAPRALSIAGHAAHLLNEESSGRNYHKRARKLATTHVDLRNALWGQLICANQIDGPEVEGILSELESLSVVSANDAVRAATAEFVVALRRGGIREVIPRMLMTRDLAPHADDALVRTAFLHTCARGLGLVGDYLEAAKTADAVIRDAERFRLTFVLPHALIAKGVAELGARHFGRCASILDRTEKLAASLGDAHNVIEAAAVRCRLLSVQHAFDSAISTTGIELHSDINQTLRAEFMASRALALSGEGSWAEARGLAREAFSLAQTIEGSVLALWATAAIAVASGTKSASSALEKAFRASCSTGNIDSFVVTYRAVPAVLAALASRVRPNELGRILADAGDADVATRLGITLPTGFSDYHNLLSPREEEVYELVVQGLTNKEIAEVLVISEVTVKVHVRHILQKLGVRSRTEAAGKATELRKRRDAVPN